MTSWDYFVGFETMPSDIDSFLKEKGYSLASRVGDNRSFESDQGGLVDLTFFPKTTPVKEGAVPDWSRSGVRVMSELMITTKDPNAMDEVDLISKAMVRNYNAVLYDPQLKQFFRKEEL